MSDKNKRNNQPEATAADVENAIKTAEEQKVELPTPPASINIDKPEPEQKEEQVFTFFQAAGKNKSGRGSGRHPNPINQPIASRQELERIYRKHGGGNKTAFILHLTNGEGLTDGAALKTFQTLVPGCEDMQQPHIYQTVDKAIRKPEEMERRIRTQRRHGWKDRAMVFPEYGKVPVRIYDMIEQEEQLRKEQQDILDKAQQA